MKKTVYQTNSDGLFLHETVAHELALDPGSYNVPYGALEQAPPAAPQGNVPQWNGKKWTIIEDHRHDRLWHVANGHEYTIGTEVEIDGKSLRFPGWGTLPLWLTSTEPSQARHEVATRQPSAASAVKAGKTARPSSKARKSSSAAKTAKSSSR